MCRKIFGLLAIGILFLLLVSSLVEAGAPSKPQIKGCHVGIKNRNMIFYVRSVDPDNDMISILVDSWGDDTGGYCRLPVPSGSWVDIDHVYNHRGLYIMKIGVVDTLGNIGGYRYYWVLIL